MGEYCMLRFAPFDVEIVCFSIVPTAKQTTSWRGCVHCFLASRANIISTDAIIPTESTLMSSAPSKQRILFLGIWVCVYLMFTNDLLQNKLRLYPQRPNWLSDWLVLVQIFKTLHLNKVWGVDFQPSAK